ncbi:exosortase B [Paucibacter sp. KCTC 42545]|uniref:exosortase B n=1 Tax=Paucibacter sp. KCTC 42545 TaxID=1768242 RepID=UPI000733AE97|nr:exosortase B [Paucibacter sp. KCTC 42545]ALT78073.1 exosortase B [Paucibacter sp. KCTC 42545]
MSTSLSSVTPPLKFDLPVILLLLFGFVAMFGPTALTLAGTVWVKDEQGHGPIIFAVALWLLYGKRQALVDIIPRPNLAWGIGMFAFGFVLYVLGRSQAILMFEVGALIPILIGLILLFKGPEALRLCWFPIFFLIFMVPLPATLVIAITTPLKSAVSAVASSILYNLGYPIGRSGVILTVGPYQLLVADACAGLNSMFTLEALGMLYMNLMNYKSAARNIALAILIVPISFVANIIRVMILVLVTYHFGDEAGQGFVHGFAGMVLFIVALALILFVDHGMQVIARLVKAVRK